MVITAPGVALVLITASYFIAVVATILYTNKIIKKGGGNYEDEEGLSPMSTPYVR